MSQMLGPLFLAIVAAPGTREERQRSPATNALQVQCPRVRVLDFPGDERLPLLTLRSPNITKSAPEPRTFRRHWTAIPQLHAFKVQLTLYSRYIAKRRRCDPP
ncbi:hypothetical protein K456DRAFT_1020195 [Colletotrichum gloeosporioides 23]|nr:hypothetical protein K456DRAFT_1020195 [Colletotrichum gloeosporioides 23]